MTDIAAAFAQIMVAASGALGAGYWPAVARWPGTPVMENGSIVTPGTPIALDCMAQVDAATEAMRGEASYTDGDVRILVLADTLAGTLDTAARIEITEGPHVGTFMIATCQRDPAAIYWDCRGRRA
ncbi:hypothetical protein ABIC65_001089 [Sphingomonas trueperi]|uniref:hypothetical protein n=1 Tax=Sphingomonas trueperi TaxID=53317 RepID=UPI00339741C7